MERLNPEKLYVEYGPGATAVKPIIGRKYTLTHSDLTADLFLTIGYDFAYDNITEMRDEVLAEWKTHERNPFLFVYLYVGQFGPELTAIRDTIFRRELPLALEAIRYGDSAFFTAYPQFDKAPICVYFDSQDPDYQKYEYWGTPQDYL